MKRVLGLDESTVREARDDPDELVWFGSDDPDPHMSLTIRAGEWVALGRPTTLTVDLPDLH